MATRRTDNGGRAGFIEHVSIPYAPKNNRRTRLLPLNLRRSLVATKAEADRVSAFPSSTGETVSHLVLYPYVSYCRHTDTGGSRPRNTPRLFQLSIGSSLRDAGSTLPTKNIAASRPATTRKMPFSSDLLAEDDPDLPTSKPLFLFMESFPLNPIFGLSGSGTRLL